MAVYRLTEAAETDIVEILAWSESQFGGVARRRYERLIVTALIDIAADPVRPGSLARPELGATSVAGIFTAAVSVRGDPTALSSGLGFSSSTAPSTPR
jgi:plasmid stabilization system protein ParE